MNIHSIPILSTAISIVICWALFAMLCSMVHEAVTRVKAERGRFMKQYLLQQLHDYPNDINWATLLYAHGSVDLLSRAADKPTSHIPPKLFAKAIVEIMGQSQAVQRKKDEVMAGIVYKQPLLRDFKAATLVLHPSDVVSLLTQSLNSAELRAASAEGVNEAKVYEMLLQNIEQWFTELTGRITEWYQKKTRTRLFIMGILMALLINVDSIELFNLFNKDVDSRTAIQQYYRQNEEWLTKYATKDSIQHTKEFVNKMDSLSRSLELPVGLSNNIVSQVAHRKERGTDLWLKLLGIFISGFAASFGAPFWFNLLKKANPVTPK